MGKRLDFNQKAKAKGIEILRPKPMKYKVAMKHFWTCKTDASSLENRVISLVLFFLNFYFINSQNTKFTEHKRC